MPGDDPGSVTAALSTAQESFRRHQGELEETLDPANAETTQLRKGCRMLEACRTLRLNDGYHTSVIEMSFGAIERTLQFYVLVESNDTIGDFQTHRYAFDRAAELGLFSRSLCDDLIELRRQNRSAAYYRNTVATDEQAEAMFGLAVEIHDFVTRHLRRSEECGCR